MSNRLVLSATFAVALVIGATACFPQPPPTDPWESLEGTCFDGVTLGLLNFNDFRYIGPSNGPANTESYPSQNGTCSGSVIFLGRMVQASDSATASATCGATAQFGPTLYPTLPNNAWLCP